MEDPAVTDARPGAPFVPTRVLSVDLASPLPDEIETGSNGSVPFGRAQVLVKSDGRPLGFVRVDLRDGVVRGADLEREIQSTLGDRAVQTLTAAAATAGAGPNAPAHRHRPPMTVVIPTIDRPEALRRCLEGVAAQTLRPLEVIVVDNAPGESGASEVVAAFQDGPLDVRYEPEPRRGASRARNRGLRATRGEVVAFLDGDARPDPRWLEGLADAMAMPLENGELATCATGAILPSELRTEPQQWLEEWGGYAKGFDRRIFDRDVHTTGSPLYPFAAGTFGSGASMAFRTADLRRLGGFDIALGPGTPARGGEDLAAFVDVITSGGTIVYEPAAIVWHEHPDTEERFRATIRAYGTGLVAYLTRHATRHPADAVRMAFAMPAALAYFFRSGSSRNMRRSPRFPPGLWKDEVAGMIQGPIAYALGRRGRRARPRR